MNIQSYKNRKLIYDKPFEVYRCLNRKGRIYSIRQNGLVVGHTDSLSMTNVELVVNSGGKKQAIKTMQRNVHAFVRGYINSSISYDGIKQLTYNPFSELGFVDRETNEPINEIHQFHIISGSTFYHN